ncbi:MAG: hypothetical protein ACLGP3_01205 [Acidobacteriota bacterium]
MSIGYVDRVTRQYIAGWAADPARPDDPVDVVIIVNGRKAAAVTCDLFRPDLQRLGSYGEGRHGFRHEFSPALADNGDVRVAVRFADSGRPLFGGDIALRGGAAAGSVVSPPPAFAAAAPMDPGALLRLFSLYEADRGLYELLCRVDFAGVRPAHLEYSVFGSVGASPLPDREWSPRVARDYLHDLLHSPRFQQDILAYVLRAYPEKRRLFFIHIPKCAGSDVLSRIAERYPLVSQHWRGFDRERFFQAMAEFAREVQCSDTVAVGGHVPLNYFVDAGLIRPCDRVFTVIRDPIEIVPSAINYAIMRIEHGLRDGMIDGEMRAWLAAVGMSSLPNEITPQFVSEVSHRALYSSAVLTGWNTAVVQANSLCRWLGGGDAAAVMARLARYHVEVTSVPHYSDWISDEWGITTQSRENVSTKYVTLSNMAPQDLAYVRGLSPEDRKLYDLIDERLTASGRTSIFGEDLL